MVGHEGGIGRAQSSLVDRIGDCGLEIRGSVRSEGAMSDWLLNYRRAIFILVSLTALIIMGTGAAAHGIASGRLVYAWLLLELCMAPVLLMRSFSGRYTLLMVFMFLYFTRFAGLDTQAILIGEAVAPPRIGFLTAAETAILLGGMLLGMGYIVTARAAGKFTQRPPADWNVPTTLLLGLMIWIVGSAAFVTMHVFLQTEKTNLSATNALGELGQYGAFVVMVGFLLQPLGLLMLAYSYARSRTVLSTAIIVVAVGVQAAIGFVTDYKATAMSGLIIVFLVRILVDNRASKAWLGAVVAFVVFAFPVYQAYRMEVTGELGLNRLQAFNRLGQVLEIAWAARDKAQSLPADERPPTFIERSDLKGNIELLMEHAGVDVPFLHGATLVDIPFAFVPRILMPDKESVSAAQEFSRQIGHGGSDTYISISHLGELYWNFGWLGLLLGMPATGVFLGWVAGRFNFEHGASLTRMMIFMVTVNEQVILFEGAISPSYVVWMRSAVAIWLLHKMFARDVGQAAPEKEPHAQAPAFVESGPLLVGMRFRASRYPNILP
jgi:hypothetical protein